MFSITSFDVSKPHFWVSSHLKGSPFSKKHEGYTFTVRVDLPPGPLLRPVGCAYVGEGEVGADNTTRRPVPNGFDVLSVVSQKGLCGTMWPPGSREQTP